MAASTNWEKDWDAEVEEINRANDAKAALAEPTLWRISASWDTWPVTAMPLLAWPVAAWSPLEGVRG